MARKHRAEIEEAYRSTGDIDRVAKAMVNSFYSGAMESNAST